MLKNNFLLLNVRFCFVNAFPSLEESCLICVMKIIFINHWCLYI
jgi:hypothetical protein